MSDVRYFPSTRHFKSYCGLSPSLRESSGKARLNRCRHRNPYLRYAFYQAAVVAIRIDDELKDSMIGLGLGVSIIRLH